MNKGALLVALVALLAARANAADECSGAITINGKVQLPPHQVPAQVKNGGWSLSVTQTVPCSVMFIETKGPVSPTCKPGAQVSAHGAVKDDFLGQIFLADKVECR